MIGGLHSERGRRRDQNSMRDPLVAVARQISNHFCSAQRLANEDDILEIQGIHDRVDIIGEGIEIVPAAGIIGTSMTAPVEGHATPAPLDKVNYWDVPPVRAQSPWRGEDDRSAGAPIP